MKYSFPFKNLLRCGIFLASLSWTLSAAQVYSYKLVAASGQTIGGQNIFQINCTPGIDDLGNIVFVARTAVSTNALFTPTSVVAKSGDGVRTGVSISEFGCPVVSHNGVAAFLAGLVGKPPFSAQGIFTYGIGDVSITEVTESSAGFSQPSINDHGQIVATSGNPQKLFLFSPSSPVALIVRGQTTLGGQTVTGTLGFNPNTIGFNDAGTVAVNTALTNGQAIITASAIVAQVGQTIAGKTLTSFGNIAPAINNTGAIVFESGFGSAGQGGIFSPTTLLVQSGQSIAGKTIAGLGLIGLNDAGVLAFGASFGGTSGIFTNTDLVIAEGQVVNGKTIEFNGLRGTAFNNAGEFAILAAFTDGTQGIITATPTTPVNFVVGSNPGSANLAFTLDGGTTVFTAPHTFQFAPGSTHSIHWTPVQNPAPGTQDSFTGWLDGSSDNPRSFLIPSVDVNYIGNFSTQFQLSTSVSPPGSGSITPGGFFNPGTQVSISAAPAAGFAFSGFTGDLTGATVPQPVTMNAPRNVTANFTALVPVSLSAAVASKGVVSPGVEFVDLQITNHGPGNASGVAITQLAFATLTGTGTVTNMTALPLAVGDIAAGSSKTVHLTLGLPASVTRFRVTENGNFQNSQHQVATFSLQQAIFP